MGEGASDVERRAVMAEKIVDDGVIAACQRGDREAFRLLFETYQDRVFSIALYSLGGDETLAKDVAQQVFLKLMTGIKQFRREAEFTTWLYRLVVNACMDEHRKRRRFLPFADFQNLDERAVSKRDEEEVYARTEISGAVHGAIMRLKPKLRMPILLKYIQGLSYEEIADVLSCSTGTVASRLNRGHKVLARKLGHLRNVSFEGE
ncbi:MAG TPA: sigma-70 family RNA polymerase sigma factor [Pyrinomonadaceae bacterium]|nr:sigma-70 family RNA polymerase sigma factor [Pyrinomonadaceae bacterium]